MTLFSIDWLFAIIIIASILLVFAMLFLYDRFESQDSTKRAAQSMFYCKKCNCIISVNDNIELYKCNHCGTNNPRLKF